MSIRWQRLRLSLLAEAHGKRSGGGGRCLWRMSVICQSSVARATRGLGVLRGRRGRGGAIYRKWHRDTDAEAEVSAVRAGLGAISITMTRLALGPCAWERPPTSRHALRAPLRTFAQDFSSHPEHRSASSEKTSFLFHFWETDSRGQAWWSQSERLPRSLRGFKKTSAQQCHPHLAPHACPPWTPQPP